MEAVDLSSRRSPVWLRRKLEVVDVEVEVRRRSSNECGIRQ